MTEKEIKLLRECNLGSKMALDTLRRVLDDTKSDDLKALIEKTIASHESLGERLHELLSEVGEEAKEPNLMEHSSVVMSVGMKLMVENTDRKIADLLIDGTNMGIKKIKGYLNKWAGEDERVREVAEKLLRVEEEFVEALGVYL
ncbi:MAG: hypothetical protein ACOYKJ_08565 [Candidatus Howiella sp.]|jgi:ferritin-like metal-binding protein YciE